MSGKAAAAEAQVPVIDMKKLSGAHRESAMAEIHSACADWGFFYVVNHGIPEAQLTKVGNLFKEYYRDHMEADFLKSDMAKAVINDGKQMQGDCDWETGFFLMHSHLNKKSAMEDPNLSESLRETMEEYSEEVKMLAEKLLEIISLNLGLEKSYLKETFNGKDKSPFFGTKMCHYPTCPRPDLVEGLRSHTDAGGLIILLQDDEIDGLEMLREEDDTWYEVGPIKGSLVIDLGDQIEAISNGLYPSRWHRVRCSTIGTRLSVASFYNPNPNAVVGPAPSLVSNGIAKYPTFAFSDYMKIYNEHKFEDKEPRFIALQAKVAKA